MNDSMRYPWFQLTDSVLVTFPEVLSAFITASPKSTSNPVVFISFTMRNPNHSNSVAPLYEKLSMR